MLGLLIDLPNVVKYLQQFSRDELGGFVFWPPVAKSSILKPLPTAREDTPTQVKLGGCTNPPKGELVLFPYKRVLLNPKQGLTKTPLFSQTEFFKSLQATSKTFSKLPLLKIPAQISMRPLTNNFITNNKIILALNKFNNQRSIKRKDPPKVIPGVKSTWPSEKWITVKYGKKPPANKERKSKSSSKQNEDPNRPQEIIQSASEAIPILNPTDCASPANSPVQQNK
jgi:hypothetical protein